MTEDTDEQGTILPVDGATRFLVFGVGRNDGLLDLTDELPDVFTNREAAIAVAGRDARQWGYRHVVLETRVIFIHDIAEETETDDHHE